MSTLAVVDADTALLLARIDEIQREYKDHDPFASVNFSPSLNREFVIYNACYTSLYVYAVVHARSKCEWLHMSVCDRRALPNGETASWNTDEWCSVNLEVYRASRDKTHNTHEAVPVQAPFLAPERERLFRLVGELADPSLPLGTHDQCGQTRFCAVPRSLWTLAFEYLRGPFWDALAPSPSSIHSQLPPHLRKKLAVVDLARFGVGHMQWPDEPTDI